MDVASAVLSAALMFIAANEEGTTPTVNWTSINEVTWWRGEEIQDTAIYPANITFKDDMISDLRDRLRRTPSFTEPLTGSAFTYGFNSKQLLPWARYWANDYDFKARQEYLNQFPMYKTNIQGLDIFYIRVTSQDSQPSNKEVAPILLMHGFPESIREFYEVIPRLIAASANTDFDIDLVVPCPPGFGYSTGADRPGFGAAQAAVVMKNFMLRLGYSKFYVVGGDLGSIIGSNLATMYPESILGYHTHWPLILSPFAVALQIVGSMHPSVYVSPELTDRAYPLYDKFTNIMAGSGFFHFQATRPDTLMLALEDSPAGLLAYVLDLFAVNTNQTNVLSEDGGLYNSYSKDSLIDNLMMHWNPKSVGTSMRFYAETFNKKQQALRLDDIPTNVPMWGIQAIYEMYYQPELVIKAKFPNLLHLTVLDYGGHFFPFEQPSVYADDVIAALKAFRKWHEDNDV